MKLCDVCIERTGGKYTYLGVYQEHFLTFMTVAPELVMGGAILEKKIALDHGYGSGSEADAGKRKVGEHARR